MEKAKYTMAECKKLLNKGLQSLADDEKRNVINSLAIHLGVTKDSVKNWIGGGLARRDVDKPIIYRNLKKSDWYLLRDIFNIIFDGVKFEEKKKMRTKNNKMSTDELMKSIDRMKPSVRRAFFGNLHRNDRKMYNEISNLYTNHKKYSGKGERNLSRYTKKREDKMQKEDNLLTNLQNGGKIKSFGRIL